MISVPNQHAVISDLINSFAGSIIWQQDSTDWLAGAGPALGRDSAEEAGVPPSCRTGGAARKPVPIPPEESSPPWLTGVVRRETSALPRN